LTNEYTQKKMIKQTDKEKGILKAAQVEHIVFLTCASCFAKPQESPFTHDSDIFLSLQIH
jgi:hypothetical protein